VGAAGYLLKQGKGYAICEAFKKRLDKLGSLKEPLAYNSNYITWEIPGIKEAAWQDLDVETHEELFEELIRYNMLPPMVKTQLIMRAQGLGELEVSEQAGKVGEKRVNERIAQWRADAKAGKAKLQILRANIELYDDAPEMIARIWRKYGPGEYEYSVTMYPVTEDLKEIHLVKIGRAYWMAGGDLVVYGGRHYVVEWDGSGALIESDFGSGLVPFCSIEFDWVTRNKETKK
jgi:hypothetical protein